MVHQCFRSVQALTVENASHWFGNNKVLKDVGFQVGPGQIVSLVGPSGCGKSTLLRAILGTHPPKKGAIWAGGQRIKTPGRHIGIVYQHYTLYDFLTAEQNVAFGLMLDETALPFRFFKFWKWWETKVHHIIKARAMLEQVNLGAAAKLYPREMSGGMRQRVAIAQALVMKPRLLLLDEPFGALDEATREELQLMLLHLYQQNLDAKAAGEEPPYTILIVTHELTEALYVADRVLGLSQYHDGGEEGATIVYDRPAPVYHPNDDKSLSDFAAQKDELRKAVFDPAFLQHHQEYLTFWDEHEKIGVEQ